MVAIFLSFLLFFFYFFSIFYLFFFVTITDATAALDIKEQNLPIYSNYLTRQAMPHANPTQSAHCGVPQQQMAPSKGLGFAFNLENG